MLGRDGGFLQKAGCELSPRGSDHAVCLHRMLLSPPRFVCSPHVCNTSTKSWILGMGCGPALLELLLMTAAPSGPRQGRAGAGRGLCFPPCASTGSLWVRLPPVQVAAVPRKEISNWVQSGWKAREEGELWAAADKPHIRQGDKGEPRALLCPPMGCGGAPASPPPTGRAEPHPGHADIQALEFLFISILLSFSHFSLLFTLPSARSHFIPRLRKAAKT